MLADVSLDDKYVLESGRIFLTGTQALVRLPMMQRQRDKAAGLNTAVFVTGYRGSPLGGVDQQFWRARKFLQNNQILFKPGLNEDLAATAIWGTQQTQLFGDSTVDGAVGIWYGKGPGVDRSGDVIRHGNLAGTSKYGGVLLLAGDDHNCKSSTAPHQTEYAFMDAMVPVLNPAGVQEFLDLGLHGIAMSRFSGCWVAFKTLADTVDTSASVYVDPHRIDIRLPQDFQMPEGGLNIRWPHPPLQQEELLHRYKLWAALAYARENRLNYTVIDSPKRRLGIVTTGKSYLDVMQALDDLHITEEFAKELGISVYKVGMSWPLEREGIRHFAEGLEEILVVEEKRALIENQLKEQLYNWREDVRPRVVGKYDEKRNWILPSISELTPAQIARVIVDRMRKLPGGDALVDTNQHFQARLKFLENKEKELGTHPAPIGRAPHFCSGCPHNTSTMVPEGSRAYAGIGCHYMATWMEGRRTQTFTQMGGEGCTWIGAAPFSKTKHTFVNLGDGTYFHSGILAIRAAVAAGVNITYKILFNDAVAMTGGQPVDGELDVATLAHQVAAEGVRKMVVVTDEPDKYPTLAIFPHGVTVHHRDELDAIQRELRETEGVTCLIYDQTCAAEKRRRRKRGTYPDPAKRAFINELVCEGCGDCSVKSNCLSVVPIETEFGRKRTIDQSSCNKDFSCVNGFCPSFVTVHGGKLRKGKGADKGAAVQSGAADIFEALPSPSTPELDEPYGILITGVGGTGVVTIGAILGMAAHLEGKGCSILDMAGLAQKGGPVTSHIRIAKKPEDIHAVRIAAGGARLIIGCDIVVATSFDAMAKADKAITRAVINTHESITADFIRKPDFDFPVKRMMKIIEEEVGEKNTSFIEGSELATALMGDSIATNMFMLGYAWQQGFVPISEEAIMKAIELNGTAVQGNQRAFLWGRRAAFDADAVRRIAKPSVEKKPSAEIAETLDDIVAKRAEFLKGYQNDAYADRYRKFIARIAEHEQAIAPGSDALAKAAARSYFKLLAYKDEYEVARLYTDGSFMRKVKEQFEGDFKLHFHLAPPIAAQRDPQTGHLQKSEYGPWMMPAFKVMAKLKFLRGTAFDLFGKTEERRMERRLITEFEHTMETVLKDLTSSNHARAVELASLPMKIRGYGHIKELAVEDVKAKEAALLEKFLSKEASSTVAAE